ncbi:DUF1330 domain-containing protein [Mycobacterium sp. URHB0044]|jgi:uncharacterized protein (DUF1330 family)|uniref:DUF1330 domain-containing protein n=1 Tax=Mycobacterium sp. URHB0044 TaxID=1380386 RepID=UPI000491AF11|nr:DUF1330 domain-containing protein [Mycobacterium sp. URHB0044]
MIAFDSAAVERYADEDTGGPVVMLNLLRFRPGGEAKYGEYAAQFEAAGINAKYGLEVLYAGVGSTALVAEDGQAWDMVVLVRYPSRQHFIQMVRDPSYHEFEHLRTEALVEAVLQATTPVG